MSIIISFTLTLRTRGEQCFNLELRYIILKFIDHIYKLNSKYKSKAIAF